VLVGTARQLNYLHVHDSRGGRRTANVGIISALSYAAYQRREFAWDRRIVAASVAGTLALFGAEG
jgi:hypothetical protein